MKLEKFSKNKKQKRIVIASIVGILLIVGGITLFRTFALYEEKLEFNVLQGRISEFSNGDIELAFTINEETTGESFPSKDSGYIGKNVTCENGVTAEWDNTVWGLVNINANGNKKIKCSIDFEALTLKDVVAVGDYVSMTPTSTSYEIANELTGCTGETDVCAGVTSQTINPSELNLWRIIRINEDGTIEMVSEYVSSTGVYFYGETGYKKLVGSLNTIAAQYANSNYTIATRHMGYDGQTEFITATLSKDTCGESSTTDNSKETSGCGDVGYKADTVLIREKLGSLQARRVNDTTTLAYYWLASRLTECVNSKDLRLVGRMVQDGGTDFYGFLYITYESGFNYEIGQDFALRPIVTLKSGIVEFSGQETSGSPWILP